MEIGKIHDYIRENTPEFFRNLIERNKEELRHAEEVRERVRKQREEDTEKKGKY